MPDLFPHGFWTAAVWLAIAEVTPLPRPCDLLRRTPWWAQGLAAFGIGASFGWHLSKGR